MLAALAMALALAAEPAADRSFRATLPNGLGVIVCHDARAPYVAVRVRYNAGSVDDPQGRSGLAHVVEHMTYEGSTHVPRALRELVELELAAHTNNAETGFHATDYHWTAPPEALEHLLWIEADRMAFVRGQHGAATLAGVQRIVANERRERVEQDPFMGLQLQAIAALFPAGDPYHGAVIGAAEEVAAATIADVDAFLGRYYTPDNAVLVIAGRVPEETRRWIELYFGDLSASAQKGRDDGAREIRRTEETRVRAARPVGPAPAVLLAWRSPGLDADGDAAADVLADALSHGEFVRLARGHAAPQIARTRIVQQSEAGRSIFFIQAIGRRGATPEAMIGEIDRVLARVASGGLTEAAVRRARQRLVREHRTIAQDPQGRAAQLLAGAPCSPRTDDEVPDRAQWLAVTPESVARVAGEVLRPNARVAVLAPGEAP